MASHTYNCNINNTSHNQLDDDEVHHHPLLCPHHHPHCLRSPRASLTTSSSSTNLVSMTSKMSVIHRSRNSANSSLKINGRSPDVNADFAQQAIFLAQQLKCSEKYIASILHAIMAVNPQHGPSQLN
ncbi:hypothetical protein JVT61DRAFT_10536 [Boletus reticuloceps]|uniref:Uncharacterized protein n=1 Tax=Boletus reticuloceps TaxID=495285 RepID=A0A8I3AE13_9AGAM|nr:hypothetical protein JVT61DRAFT_10536 [Boletus reticuloceps]